MCGNGLSSRARVCLLSLLLLAAVIGPLVSQEIDYSQKPESSTSENSETQMQSWQSLDDLLNELIAESEASVVDWITLSAKLAALKTEADALSSSLEVSKKQYELSVKAWAEVTAAAQRSLDEEAKARAKAEKEARIWKIAGACGITLGIGGGLVAWYGLTH